MFFGVIISVFIVVGLAVGYNSGVAPNVFGHSVDELETCDDEQFLKTINGSWECVDSEFSGMPTNVYYVYMETAGWASVAEEYCINTYGSNCHLGGSMDQTGADEFYCWCWD